MSMKYHWPQDLTLEEALLLIQKKLSSAGYTIDKRQEDWRVCMARKDCNDWTQFFTGLTTKRKEPRRWLRVSGPEEGPILTALTQGAADV